MDIGTFDQAIWGTLHGDFFLNTTALNQSINYLGFHFRPILIFFIPFYTFLPKVEWLIVAQCLALSLAAWPIFSIAKNIRNSDFYAFFWVMIYFVNPFVLSIPPWVFRPEALAVPFIFTAFLSVEKRNFLLLIFSCCIILIVKEHFGIMVIGFGLLWGIRNKKWKQSIIIISLGLLYSFIILSIIMPLFSPTEKHIMISEGLGQVSRYNWLGNSFKEIFQTLIFKPFYVLKELLKMGSLSYLLLLLIFFLGFPLAAPEFLLAGSADLLANILSRNPMPRSILAYHSISLIPVFIVAAIYGVKRITHYIKRYSANELTIFILIASIAGGYYLAPLPLPGALNHWAPVKFLNWPDPILQSVKDIVPSDISVSAQGNIGAHFSQRREIYQFPNKIGEVDTIILRLKSPTHNIAVKNTPRHLLKYKTGMLDAHLQMDRKEYIDSIEGLLQADGYKVSLWDDSWLVFSRNLPVQEKSYNELIKHKLNQLRNEWNIE